MKKLENGNYEITKLELVEYEYSARKLNALEGFGVDNWEGYSIAEWDTYEEIELDIINNYK